jgi:GT2 family glycosyltransferase
MRVAAIIPHWKGEARLVRCVSSLAAQQGLGDALELEIIVVDNGSTGGSAAAAEVAGARLIRLDRNAGFAAAVNRGVTDSDSDFVAVLNDDAHLHPAWLAHLLDALDRYPSCGMAAGCIYRTDAPTIIDGAGDALSLGFSAARLGNGFHGSPAYHQERPVLAVSGTACLIRREVFRATGAFEEAFFAYLEDVEFCLRAQLGGFAAIYVPSAIAWHEGSASTGGRDASVVSARVAEWLTAHQLLLAARFMRRGAVASTLPRFAIAQLLWAAHLVRRRRTRAWLRGLRLAVPLVPRMRAWHFPDARGPARLLGLLRASESQIHSDRGETDSIWKWYFRLFPPEPAAFETPRKRVTDEVGVPGVQ